MSTSNTLADLRLQRFRFTLRCQTAMHLDEFVGNDLRGDFGFVLGRYICLHSRDRQPRGDGSLCDRCDKGARCLYDSIFDSRDSQGRKVVRPYVIEPLFPYRTYYAPGDAFRFNLVLVGRALDSLYECVGVFDRLGRSEPGPEHQHKLGRFEVERVECTDSGGTVSLVCRPCEDVSKAVPWLCCMNSF